MITGCSRMPPKAAPCDRLWDIRGMDSVSYSQVGPHMRKAPHPRIGCRAFSVVRSLVVVIEHVFDEPVHPFGVSVQATGVYLQQHIDGMSRPQSHVLR